MMYKALIGAGLSLCAAACASSPSAPAVRSQAQLPPTGCVSQTGTRIPMSPSECAAAGHTWTDGALRSTGATNPAEALRLLDPTVTTGH